MDVRAERAARLRRLARSRPLALVGLYGAAAAVATAPGVASFRSAFIAGGAPGLGEAAAGDHLQAVYRFWLVGHQLGRGAAPWRDPYTFQPLAGEQANLAGWPFGLPFWPLQAAFGPVVAWNVLLLATIVVAGLATYGWLRLWRLPPAAAAIGGLAFALAPYRLAQSGGHLLGWAAIFLPLSLWAYERARVAPGVRGRHAWGALAACSLVSIPLSGQVHLALGAVPFVLAYGALRCRRGPLLWLVAAAAASVALGLLIREAVIAESAAAGGRTLDQVRMFQAGWLDLVDRFRGDKGLEQYAFAGWLTPVAALAGLVLAWRRRPRLAALLGLAAVVPLLLALGTNLPTYELLWRYVPGFGYPRVPGRLVPIAGLALAALAALAAWWLIRRARPRWRPVAAAAAFLLVAGDLLVLPLRPTAADPENGAYLALAREDESPGRVVELPLFEPGIHHGSVYHYYALQAPRERPGGYSSLAPVRAYGFFWELNRLNCGVALPGDWRRLRALGVDTVLFHAGAFAQSGRPGAWFAWRLLERRGYRSSARDGRIWAFPLVARPDRPEEGAPVPEPDRSAPVFCEGWHGWTMKERDAPLWVFGQGAIEIEVSAPRPLPALVRVDGGAPRRIVADPSVTLVVELRGERWHRLHFQIGALLQTSPPRGLEITRITYPRAGASAEPAP
ncbi:MAG: hypothetical protein IT201_01860 [Thermoleophilia bacterium]|nr:hypothetical protein [Thermoleophilia bacterium]